MMIESSDVAGRIERAGTIVPPATESVARPLAKLPASEQADAWEKIVTNADKRRSVMRLLQDEEWGQWSDREIARRCGVSDPFVGKLRSSLQTVSSEPRTYTTKHGTGRSGGEAAFYFLGYYSSKRVGDCRAPVYTGIFQLLTGLSRFTGQAPT